MFASNKRANANFVGYQANVFVPNTTYLFATARADTTLDDESFRSACKRDEDAHGHRPLAEGTEGTACASPPHSLALSAYGT